MSKHEDDIRYAMKTKSAVIFRITIPAMPVVAKTLTEEEKKARQRELEETFSKTESQDIGE